MTEKQQQGTTTTARHRFDAETWVGLEAIAENLRRGRKTVRRWITTKAFPAFQIDGRGPWTVLVDDAIQWLRDQRNSESDEKNV